MALLSFLTLGVYSVYWLYHTTKELRKYTGETIPHFGYMIVPTLAATLLGILSVLTQEPALIIILIISAFLVLGISLWWYWKYCAVASIAIKKEYSTGLLFFLFLLLDDFMPIFLQWKFNGLKTK